MVCKIACRRGTGNNFITSYSVCTGIWEGAIEYNHTLCYIAQLAMAEQQTEPLASQCLKKEMLHSSAFQLNESLSELKQAPQYTESMNQTPNSSEIEQLKDQIQSQIEVNTREDSEHRACNTQLQSTVEAKDTQFQEIERAVLGGRELWQTQELLQDSQQLVAQFQQHLQLKTITDPQEVLSHQEATVAKKDISKMKWREGKKPPEKMCSGAAVVYGSTAYFTPLHSAMLYSYQNTLGNEQWSKLPDNPNQDFSLAVIDGFLTSVGGYTSRGPNDYVATSTLLSLREEGERKQWSEVFLPMPTPRWSTACIPTEQALVVAGGRTKYYRYQDLATVEVMNIDTKQWTTVCPLPLALRSLSGIACGDILYLAGGIEYSWCSWHEFDSIHCKSRSVFTCSLSDLLQAPRPETFISKTLWSYFPPLNKWKEISALPVIWSTLTSFGGHLLAIGGQDDSFSPTTDIYRYNSYTDSWHVVSQMKNKQSRCFAVTLPEDRLIVVGGWTDSVEILEDK